MLLVLLMVFSVRLKYEWLLITDKMKIETMHIFNRFLNSAPHGFDFLAKLSSCICIDVLDFYFFMLFIFGIFGFDIRLDLLYAEIKGCHEWHKKLD